MLSLSLSVIVQFCPVTDPRPSVMGMFDWLLAEE